MNKKIRITLCLILSMAMLFVFVGCQSTGTTQEPSDTTTEDAAPEDTTDEDANAVDTPEDPETSDEPFQIGVAMADFSIPFFVSMIGGMEEEAEKAGVELDMQDGKSDPNVQVGQIETFMTQGKDLIIVVAAQLDALVPVAKECNAAGIPIITVNRQLGEGADVLTYVGCDDILGGNIQGELVHDLLGEEGKIVIVQGGLGTSPQVMREQGLEEYLAANAPGIEVVAKQTAEWDQSKAITITQNFLTKYAEGEIDAIVSQGPYMTVGIVQGVKAAERDELLGKIIAFDLPQEVVDAITDKDMYGTVLQNPRTQGALGIEVAYKFLSGELQEADIEAQTWTVLPKVNIDNISEYTAAW